MTDPDTIREIQRLMDESRGTPRDPGAGERSIARLLGIGGAALRELPPAEEVTAGGELEGETR